LLLLVAAAGLATAGRPELAAVFAAVVVIDWVATVLLGPAALEAFGSSTAARR
jgi:hypothetical protein